YTGYNPAAHSSGTGTRTSYACSDPAGTSSSSSLAKTTCPRGVVAWTDTANCGAAVRFTIFPAKTYSCPGAADSAPGRRSVYDGMADAPWTSSYRHWSH